MVETCVAGHPALIQKDNLYYMAGWPNDEAMLRILSDLADQSGLKTQVMQGGERQRQWGDYRLNVNYDTGEITLTNMKTQQKIL